MPAKRLILPRRMIAATHNLGKLAELGALLAPLGCQVLSAGALGLAEPEETEDSFAGNAALKARAAALAGGEWALADDSGLEVAALGGRPGVLSARWAGPQRDFGLAMGKIEEALAQSAGKDRSARFVCALALAGPDGAMDVFEGDVHGEIVWPPRGQSGFGYDPIFQPLGHTLTFGEMEPAAKEAMSHRAQAFAKLVAALG